MTVHKALAKRLYISLDFCYTFVLQKSSDVLCCGQTVRHFTIQFFRLSNLEACLHRRFFPFATAASKITQNSADFHDKMECDRRKQLHWKIYQSVSVYFMKVNEERRLERATLKTLVRKVDIENAGGPIMATRQDTRP